MNTISIGIHHFSSSVIVLDIEVSDDEVIESSDIESVMLNTKNDHQYDVTRKRTSHPIQLIDNI